MNNIIDSNVYDISDLNDLSVKLDNVARYVVKLLLNMKLKVSTAESLTGGMISQYITSVEGASEIIELGICSYSDRIKHDVLGVSEQILSEYSAVSEQTALAMADGVMKISGSDVAVAVTGIAGPGGGTQEQPVGTVYVAVRYKDIKEVRNLKLYEKHSGTDRTQIRMLTTVYALLMIADVITGDRK